MHSSHDTIGFGVMPLSQASRIHDGQPFQYGSERSG